jgi:hypothetical protein
VTSLVFWRNFVDSCLPDGRGRQIHLKCWYSAIWHGNENVMFTIMKTSSSPAVICQTTGPKPLPKRFLHIVRSRASSFNWLYPLLSLRSSNSFLHLLPRLLVTSICPFISQKYLCDQTSKFVLWIHKYEGKSKSKGHLWIERIARAIAVDRV